MTVGDGKGDDGVQRAYRASALRNGTGRWARPERGSRPSRACLCPGKFASSLMIPQSSARQCNPSVCPFGWRGRFHSLAHAPDHGPPLLRRPFEPLHPCHILD